MTARCELYKVMSSVKVLIMLSVVTNGKTNLMPTMNVYIEPLIDKLLKLWNGVNMYDIFRLIVFSFKTSLSHFANLIVLA